MGRKNLIGTITLQRQSLQTTSFIVLIFSLGLFFFFFKKTCNLLSLEKEFITNFFKLIYITYKLSNVLHKEAEFI